MVFRGRVKNGKIVLDQGPALEEGLAVSVRPLRRSPRNGNRKGDRPLATLYERLKPAFGIVKGLPADFAAEHDHYIHGTPKRANAGLAAGKGQVKGVRSSRRPASTRATKKSTTLHETFKPFIGVLKELPSDWASQHEHPYLGTPQAGGADHKPEEDWKAGIRSSRRRLAKSWKKNGSGTSFYEQFKDLIGTAKGLPADFSTQLDHYLYGAPKRK